MARKVRHSALESRSARLKLQVRRGRATGRLAATVADGRIVCSYGAMDEDSVVVANSDLAFRGVNVVGFLLGRTLAKRSQVRASSSKRLFQMTEGDLVVITRGEPHLFYSDRRAKPFGPHWRPSPFLTHSGHRAIRMLAEPPASSRAE